MSALSALPPTVIAMYCVPSWRYVMGADAAKPSISTTWMSSPVCLSNA